MPPIPIFFPQIKNISPTLLISYWHLKKEPREDPLMITTKHRIHDCFTSGVLGGKSTHVIQPCRGLWQYHCHAVLRSLGIIEFVQAVYIQLTTFVCGCVSQMWDKMFFSPCLVTQRLLRALVIPPCRLYPCT